MKRIAKKAGIWFLGMCLMMAFSLPSRAADVPRITKEELKGMLGNENVIIIDVRSDLDQEKSKQKIQGAVLEDPGKVETWMSKYPKDKTLVFYCAWPAEHTSAGAAQQFLSKGYTKIFALKGGWWEWVEAKFPVENK
jgi:rhodanese-related sulfurtransferase